MAQPLRVIYFGTPDFALPPLAALVQNKNFEIQAVVTQEDKKVGRKQILTPPPVKQYAQEKGIPVLQPPTLRNNNEFLTMIKELAPDFIVVAVYGKFLPQEVLEAPRYSCVNIHPSLLPKYRGASPFHEALLQGDTVTGVSFMKMTEEMDSGPLYLVDRVPIDPFDNAETLRYKLMYHAAQLLPSVLEEIAQGDLQPIEQDHSKATYSKKITKEEGAINVYTQTAQEIFNKLRAYTPWPGCYLMLPLTPMPEQDPSKLRRLKLLQCEIDTASDQAKNTAPGQIVDITKDRIGIGTLAGLLIPLQVQLEGKKPVSISDFLRGNREMLSRHF